MSTDPPAQEPSAPQPRPLWHRPQFYVPAGILILVLFGVLGTFSDDDDGSDGGSDVNSDLGDVRSQVIAEINSTTDCGELQAAFDRNDANHARNLEQGKLDLAQLNTDYMIAIDDRMRDIGCYGG